MNDFGFTFNNENLNVDKEGKYDRIEKDETIIREIHSIMDSDIEDGTYMSATLEWLSNNDYKINKTVLGVLPSFIINELKREACEENLVRPSMNPNMRIKSNKMFNEFFMNN